MNTAHHLSGRLITTCQSQGNHTVHPNDYLVLPKGQLWDSVAHSAFLHSMLIDASSMHIRQSLVASTHQFVSYRWISELSLTSVKKFQLN